VVKFRHVFLLFRRSFVHILDGFNVTNLPHLMIFYKKSRRVNIFTEQNGNVRTNFRTTTALLPASGMGKVEFPP
jgi:hypothetical protein